MMDGLPIRRTETAANLIWIAVGTGIAAAAWSTGVWSPAGPGSGFLGLIAGLAILGGGLILLISGESADRSFRVDGTAARRVLSVLGGLAAIAVVMPHLGFIITASLILMVLLYLLERQSWLSIVAFSVLSTLAVHTVFDRFLGAALPKGPLGF